MIGIFAKFVLLTLLPLAVVIATVFHKELLSVLRSVPVLSESIFLEGLLSRRIHIHTHIHIAIYLLSKYFFPTYENFIGFFVPLLIGDSKNVSI